MDLLSALETVNYGLVTLFGFFLSTETAGGWANKRQKTLILLLCPALLLLQSVCWLFLGVEQVRRIYPLIVHLPLVLSLIFALKKPVGVSAVSVFTAYLCCQIPRWVKLAVLALTSSPLAGELCYTVFIFPIFFLLHRFFVRTAHATMTLSGRMLFLFGSLPVAYYVFDYATAVYSDALYVGLPVLTEFFPTALVVFYVIFLAAYHAQARQRTQAELQNVLFEAELKQSEEEIETLRRVESQTAIYQHNMRHHLNAIAGYLSSGSPAQAEEYIKNVQADVEAITPKRFCDHELVNLLCSSFAGKAEALGLRFAADVRLPNALSVSDTELCALLSNALENAFHAAQVLAPPLRWVEFSCQIRVNKLLIEVKNPYEGEVLLRDGLPVSRQKGHGYGCRSIRSIAQRCRGICTFEPKNGLFTLQTVLPLEAGGQQGPSKH